MLGFRRLAQAAGAEYLRGEVVALEMQRSRVAAVRLDDGRRIGCGHFVNAAGGQGAVVAAMAGIAIPVERRKRTVFSFVAQTRPEGQLPLMIDPSGVWCRPEGAGFIAGSAPDPDPAVEAEDFAPRHGEWEETVWPALAARSRAFEAVKLTGFWAGHYDMNTLDQNAIVGPHPEITNFHLANGFSGHGLQQAPAIGRGIAEMILHGGYRSLDLSPLGYARIAEGRPFLERAVI
jgi:glycine/D-amino acid oxidase-like deaminating enzyme